MLPKMTTRVINGTAPPPPRTASYPKRTSSRLVANTNDPSSDIEQQETKNPNKIYDRFFINSPLNYLANMRGKESKLLVCVAF